MDEETRVEETVQETTEGTENSGGSEPVSFDDMLKNGYQAEFDRRVSKALNTAKTRWEQEQADSQDEAKKLAGMTKTQQERYQLDKDKAAFAQQQEAFAVQQLQVQMGSALQQRGLPASMAKWITGKDADTSMANLEEFETSYRAAVQSGINGVMRGKNPPAEPKKEQGEDPFLAGFNSKK